MDPLAQRLIFAVEELWTALAELRATLVVVAAHDAGTTKMYETAIIAVELARQQLATALGAISIAEAE